MKKVKERNDFMKVKSFLKRNTSSLMAFGLERVASGTIRKVCYFIFYQPKVPADMKEFLNSRK
jgi:cyclic lactone autoinducer peptide